MSPSFSNPGSRWFGWLQFFSRFSDFRLCSLLLKVDLTPVTKKKFTASNSCVFSSGISKMVKTETGRGKCEKPKLSWGKDGTWVLPHLDPVSSNFFIQGLLISLSSGCHQALHCVALLWIIISCYWNYIRSLAYWWFWSGMYLMI